MLDGLGWEQLAGAPSADADAVVDDRRPDHTPWRPTTTATALSSIATGLTPGEHGLIGYRMVLGGEVLNVLRWTAPASDRRRSLPAARRPAVRRRSSGTTCRSISPAELQSRRSPRPTCAARAPSAGGRRRRSPVEVRRQLAAGERFVYAYYGGIDKIAHERGFGEYYDAELRFADRLVADVLDALPPAPRCSSPPTTARSRSATTSSCPIRRPAGAGRACSPARALPLAARRPGARRRAGRGGHRALRRRGLGRHPGADRSTSTGSGRRWRPPSRPASATSRSCARAPVSFHDPADSGPFELVCRHGSLTSAEVLVPLLARHARVRRGRTVAE